jgi:hypothetical protein
MKRKKSFKIATIFLIICLLAIPSVQSSNRTNIEQKEIDEVNSESTGTNENFQNSIIIVFGKCDRVEGPLVWLLGFYCPLLKRNFRIIANGGQNESLNAIVLGRGSLGAYFSRETMWIDIRGARGLLFNFDKSILVNGNNVIAICRAENIFINIP